MGLYLARVSMFFCFQNFADFVKHPHFGSGVIGCRSQHESIRANVSFSLDP